MIVTYYTGEIDTAALKKALYTANGIDPVEVLSDWDRLYVEGTQVYINLVLYDEKTSDEFRVAWESATGLSWAKLTPQQRAEVLVAEEARHFAADLDLAADDFTKRMVERIGEASGSLPFVKEAER